MKRIYTIIAVLLIAFCIGAPSAFGQVLFAEGSPVNIPRDSKTEGSVVWGYCGPEITKAIGIGSTKNLKAAICITQDRIGYFKENNIIAVNIGVSAKVSGLSLFFRSSLNGEDLYRQDIGDAAKGWHEIILSAPFAIPDEDLYICYEATGLAQIGFCGTTAYEEGCWVDRGSGWGNYATNGWGSACIQAIIDAEAYPSEEVGLLTVNNIVTTEEQNVGLKGKILNNSSTPVEKFVLRYQINGQAPVEKEYNIPIEPMQTAEYDLDEILNLNADNPTYNITTTVLSVNDKPDQYPDNDETGRSLVLHNNDDDYTKRVVVEEGTGTWCAWCTRGIVGMKMMKEKYPGTFIGIAVHNNDPMTIGDYDFSFGSYITGYPQCVAGRKETGDPYYDIEEMYLRELNNTPFAGIGLEAVVDAGKNTITAESNVEFCFSADYAAYRVAYVIIENGITGYPQANAYAGGDYGMMGGFELLPVTIPAGEIVFDDVAVGIHEGFLGVKNSIPAKITKSQQIIHSCEIAIPEGVQNPENLEIVAMLVDVQSGEIINAIMIVPEYIPVRIEKVEANNIISNAYIYDNIIRATVAIQGKAVVSLYDVSGRKIYGSAINIKRGETITIPVHNKGVYILRIDTDEGSETRKLM